MKNNADSLVAKKICEHLEVKWKFFEFKKPEFRSLYFSKFKEQYDKYSDNFSILPNYQDIFFLKDMQKNYFLKKMLISLMDKAVTLTLVCIFLIHFIIWIQIHQVKIKIF